MHITTDTENTHTHKNESDAGFAHMLLSYDETVLIQGTGMSPWELTGKERERVRDCWELLCVDSYISLLGEIHLLELAPAPGL